MTIPPMIIKHISSVADWRFRLKSCKIRSSVPNGISESRYHSELGKSVHNRYLLSSSIQAIVAYSDLLLTAS